MARTKAVFHERFRSPDVVILRPLGARVTTPKRWNGAQEAAVRIKGKYDPFMLGKQLFGPYLSNSTAFALKGAESQSQGLTLLLMSPEFQRR